MSGKFLCIHGHFYQPPREDPWLDMIFPEGSSAPFRHWNERICRESYGPLAWARRMGGDGIFDIVNCYEWMSFNVGPTLFRWIERAEPELYAKIIEGDALSLKRWGHGNAIAQIYHHVIMPLASELDRDAEVAWAVADFESRFKRKPEGMWLSETACNTDTLETLADHGIAFTLLAPRQAESIADLNSDDWQEVDEYSINIKEPYLVELPSGRTISVFFYDGGLSQAIAFEGLLKNGDEFWNKLSGASAEGLLSIGTDGETYGHHVEFGEMALAYVLAQAIEERDGISLLNYGAYLEQNPPTRKVKIREDSSWSCYHGIERWRADCGCCTGGHPDWNQQWRRPLREGLDAVKTLMNAHYFNHGDQIFKDSRKALIEYGTVLSGLATEEEFFKQNFKVSKESVEADMGWKLLSMQKWALSSFASCGWFFDDLARLEPVNNMSFALRAIEIAQETGLIGLEEKFLSIAGEARSNEERYGSTVDLWSSKIKPQSETPGSLIGQALARLYVEGVLPQPGEEGRIEWPGVSVLVRTNDSSLVVARGEAEIKWHLESELRTYGWKWEKGERVLTGSVEVSLPGGQIEHYPLTEISWKKKQSLALTWVNRFAQKSWETQILNTGCGPVLFNEFEDYQTSQTWAPRWRKLWPGLAWSYIFSGDNVSKDFLLFMKEVGHDHADVDYFIEQLAKQLCVMLHNDLTLWDSIRGVIERARKINLPVDLWRLQNCYWDKILLGENDPELAKMIGFDL
ncbi:DUF3536 domain-containing protein [Desulfovibrio sp. JC022]|uniref:DUF3536 domain-containing protein n=1 Tax=Desulfovibrio sp. JC022 TaxID=2593642 RepID=UPI0013D89AF7|nr:DUF3536 domain-containing protein [Desulfovibrio sp. JC022]NDV24415.1 DUF3536 domain-containing protein [Desulfovibrio sp. JC022]